MVAASCFAVLAAVSPPTARADGPRLRIESPGFSPGSVQPGAADALPSAGPSSRAGRTPLRSAPTAEPGFVRGYLLPRLSSRFDGLAPRHPITDGPQEQVDQPFYDDLTDAAERSAERGARDALKNFLFDTTAIGKLFGRTGRPAATGSVESAPTSRAARGSSDFGVGISGGRPEVEWSFRSVGRSLRLRVDLDGAAGFSFSRSRQNRTDLSVAYNPRREQYSLFFRLGF